MQCLFVATKRETFREHCMLLTSKSTFEQKFAYLTDTQWFSVNINHMEQPVPFDPDAAAANAPHPAACEIEPKTRKRKRRESRDWEVEAITGKRRNPRTRKWQYKIKWKGFIKETW